MTAVKKSLPTTLQINNARSLADTLGGAVVAQRESDGSVTYLHGDHLGSVSVQTDAQGSATPNGKQEYDPWGALRSGGIPGTTLNYTGQRRDATGLLYYNARYYDPAIGRFISADTVVPGNAAGGMDGVAVRPMTVAFHEGGLRDRLNGENRRGPWFELSRDEQRQNGSVWGPADPQMLNRYSYVRNNPLRWTDPSGHDNCDTPGCGGIIVNHTNHSIFVIGGRLNSDGTLSDGQVMELLAGESSADVGMTDVDGIVIEQLDKDHIFGYKVLSSERADVYTNEKGETVIAVESKEGGVTWIKNLFGRGYRRVFPNRIPFLGHGRERIYHPNDKNEWYSLPD